MSHQDGLGGDSAGTDLRFKLGKGVVVQIRSKDELGPTELERLMKLIGAQRDVLMMMSEE